MSDSEIHEDFLEVDQPIPGQNYACLSFISPESVIKQKEVFFMKKFMYELLTNENKRKYILEMDPENLTYEKVNDMVEDFRIVNEKKVNDEFDEIVDFKTSVRGVKIRGIYDTLKEAKIRSNILQKRDPKFNVFIGQCGYWLPWDPSYTEDIDSEYQEGQLNELMKNYKINAEQRDMFYQQEKQEKVNKAIQENIRKKEENAKKGDIDPSKEPKEDAKANIKELRDILDEKDRIFNKIISDANVNNNNAGGTEQVAITGDSKTDNTDNTDESNKMFDEKHSDPWMKRKIEGEEELNVSGDNTEIMSHSSNNVTGQDEDGLKEVAKNIF